MAPPASAHRPHTRGENRHTHADPGMRIVLTPMQMAAIIHGANITPHAAAINRLWGEVITTGGPQVHSVQETKTFTQQGGGTFLQDFAMYGETLPQITGACKRDGASPGEAARALQKSIKIYLAEHPDDTELETHFYKTFYPDLESGASGSVKHFLTEIATLLMK